MSLKSHLLGQMVWKNNSMFKTAEFCDRNFQISISILVIYISLPQFRDEETPRKSNLPNIRIVKAKAKQTTNSNCSIYHTDL